MAYDNVTRPELPTSYIAETYPNYVMVFNYARGTSDWYQVHMYYSGNAFTYDGSRITNAEGIIRKDIYGDGWTGEVVVEDTPNLVPGLHGDVYQRIYTNHDILDGAGNVYLAADTVTPVKLFDLKSWLTGFSLGLAGKPLPLAVRKPVAYLYNGVRLPELPEWDKETYPYACILKVDKEAQGEDIDYCFIFYGSHPRSVHADGHLSYVTHARYDYIDGAWVMNPAGNFFITRGRPVWSNTDVYYLDDVADVGGTLYLAASEPVPVYV